MADHPQGQRLGKYRILQRLGKGGFATIYRALDTTLDREVALKVLDPLLTRDETWVARFRREARAVARFKHPHIVHIYEVDEAEGRLFITMELIEGPALSALIATPGRLSWNRTLEIFAQIADALDFAHNEGIIHRDLKPSNILFDPRAGVLLTDFGFAKLVGESSMSISVSGGVVGTPAYIAPEVWEGMAAGPGTDVYALGCILFEMLTGEVLFKGDTPPAVMRNHFQPRQYPEQWPEGVPPQVRGVLEKALAPDPAARHPSGGAFVADLRRLSVAVPDPLAGPYRALQEALAVDAWERAIKLAGEISAQDPDYRDVQALARRAAAGQAAAERARRAAQWRAQALAAEQAGQIEAAHMAVQRWLEMAPEDADAQAMLRRLSPDPLTAQEWERAPGLAQEITAQDPNYQDVREPGQRAAEMPTLAPSTPVRAGPLPVPAEKAPPISPARSRRRFWLLGLAALLVVSTVVVLLVRPSGGGDPTAPVNDFFDAFVELDADKAAGTVCKQHRDDFKSYLDFAFAFFGTSGDDATIEIIGLELEVQDETDNDASVIVTAGTMKLTFMGEVDETDVADELAEGPLKVVKEEGKWSICDSAFLGGITGE